LLQLNPRSVPGNYWKAAVLARDGNAADALAALKLVYFQRPTFRQTYDELGRLLGTLERTGQRVDRCFLEVPRLVLEAERALDLKQWSQAEQRLQQVLSLDPDNAVAHEKLGDTYAEMNRPAEAARHRKRRLQAYEIALKEDPKNADLLNEAAEFLLQT